MSLRDTLEKIRSHPVPDNEEMAKFQILAPILGDLQWDPFGQEVRWEYPVGGKKSGGKADIALRAKGRIWALIEAKAPGANLNHHVEQVLGYAFYEGVGICALSDGLQWWLYCPLELGHHEERRFAVLDLAKDPIDQICDDLNTFLGRESLVSGQALKQAKQVRGALREAAQLEKEMPAIWKQMLDEPDDELVELIGQRVYDKLSLRPGREQIVAAMRKMPIPAMKPKTTGIQDPLPPTASNPTAVVLWGTHHPVKQHSDILMTVVEELYKRHLDDFDQIVGPLSYKEWQYVSRDSALVGGKNPKRTPSGYFVNVNLTAKVQRLRWTKLLEAFGYSESDLQLLFEATKIKKSPGKKRTPCPVAIRLWDEHHPIERHYEILITLVAVLHKRHPGSFDKVMEQLKGKKWQYVSLDPQRVYDERRVQIPSGHYVDINVSAKDVAVRCRRMLEAFGHSQSDLEYLYEG